MFSCRASFSGVFHKIFIEVPKFHKSPLSRIISGCTPALSYYSFCKMLHLKCLTVFGIRLCLDNCSVICTVTLCRIMAYSALCFFRQPCPQRIFSCHILSLRIFRTGSLFKTPWNVDQAYSEPCHRALYSHIQNLLQRLHAQKLGKLGILEFRTLQ